MSGFGVVRLTRLSTEYQPLLLWKTLVAGRIPYHCQADGGWVGLLYKNMILDLRGKPGWRDLEICRGSSDPTCPATAVETWIKLAPAPLPPRHGTGKVGRSGTAERQGSGSVEVCCIGCRRSWRSEQHRARLPILWPLAARWAGVFRRGR